MLFVPLGFSQAQKSQSSAAAVNIPRLIRFAGVLKDATGAPLSGTVGITFTLHKEQQGGAALWIETQNVPLSNGRYNLLLGATKADGVPMDLFTSGDAQWLGVHVQGEAEQPRVLLVSVPYALKAGDAETVGGKPASAFMLAPATTNSLPTATSQPNTLSASTQSGTAINATVSGGGTTNFIPLWTSSTALGNSALFQSGLNVGIGGNSVLSRFTATSSISSGVGVTGQASATSSNTAGVLGISASGGGWGIVGANTGGGTGVYGKTAGISGLAKGAASVLGDSHSYYGVWGTSAANDGVHGDTASASHYGAAGVNQGGGAGVYGLAAGKTGQGVYGESFGAGFANNIGADGVHGVAHTNAGSGVAGINNATGGTGVFASAPSGFGMATDSNTTQARGMGGWLKAMVYVDPFTPGIGTAITRC
ncbi:MAG: hypothetical protein NVS1B11_25900 [Terriglobales bacterium]